MHQLNEKPSPALFRLEGPDDDGCIWILGTEGAEAWRRKLGPEDAVAEVMLRWLGAVHVRAEPSA